ncbi:MAG: hypothetical protein JWO62_1674 [Acidimicrobiaceae bacterium]|jgi:hypothetical protein|nr:hypothetical protein [Acidimicrobiaceae bacterium]
MDTPPARVGDELPLLQDVPGAAAPRGIGKHPEAQT